MLPCEHIFKTQPISNSISPFQSATLPSPCTPANIPPAPNHPMVRLYSPELAKIISATQSYNPWGHKELDTTEWINHHPVLRLLGTPNLTHQFLPAKTTIKALGHALPSDPAAPSDLVLLHMALHATRPWGPVSVNFLLRDGHFCVCVSHHIRSKQILAAHFRISATKGMPRCASAIGRSKVWQWIILGKPGQ